MSVTRRAMVSAGLGLIATSATAEGARDVAPPASDAPAWSGYEGRLRDRLADAGGGRFDAEGAQAILPLTNAARAAIGAGALDWHDELACAARAHAADLAHRGYLEHLTPEGFDPSHRFWLVSRTTIGSPSENIAYHRGRGPSATPAQMLNLWRSSPGHWRNLLRPDHSHVGYGMVRREDRAWLVGLYARPLVTLPEALPFRAQGPQVARALAQLAGELRPRIAVPQGARLGAVQGAPPVMQITAVRVLEPDRFDVVGGPIFLVANT